MSFVNFSLAKQYTHTQDTPSDAWAIDYKMDFVPIVEVLIDNGGTLEKMIPQSVERITNHSVVVHFATPYSGVAHIVG